VTTGLKTSDGADLAWSDTGPVDAPVLVLLHSLGSDRSMWRPQVERLSIARRVLAIDTRGHGASTTPPGPASLDALGTDVIATVDHLGIDAFHVCGVSLGGMTALWLGIHASRRLLSLTACNTAAKIGDAASWNARIEAVRSAGMESIRDAVVSRWFAPGFADRHPDWFEEANNVFAHTDPEGYAACCAALAVADLREQVGGIERPALIVGGDLDVATPPESARWLHEEIRGSELEILADAAHLSNLDRPDAFTSRLDGFLSSV